MDGVVLHVRDVSCHFAVAIVFWQATLVAFTCKLL